MPTGKPIIIHEHYIPVTESGCWIWAGKIGSHGYGSSKKGLAHRQSYEHFVGPIPDGLCVLHKCDTRPCINPSHLFLGTKRDNYYDMKSKGRKAEEFTRKASISRACIEQIRDLARDGQLTQIEIAEAYNMDRSTVSKIKRGFGRYS